MAYNAIDLFAGAGGMSLGLIWSGWEVLGVEQNSYAVSTHRRMVGPCAQADVTQWSPPYDVQLVCGGAPCQSFSPAGRKRGMGDPRGNLWRQILRVAGEASARVALLENTSGLKGMKCEVGIGKAFDEAGFRWVETTILDAADYGVPQFRRRIFIIGFRDKDDADRFHWPAPTHGDPASDAVRLGTLRPWVSVREALGLGQRRFRTGGKIHEDKYWWGGNRRIDVDRPYWTVNTRKNAEWLDPIKGELRRLKLEDLKILQGFPREFQFSGRVLEDKNIQMGNALPPPMGMALGHALKDALR